MAIGMGIQRFLGSNLRLAERDGTKEIIPSTQKLAVICMKPHAGEDHIMKADDAKQPKGLKKQHSNTHTANNTSATWPFLRFSAVFFLGIRTIENKNVKNTP
jgi:hypothetical protein